MSALKVVTPLTAEPVYAGAEALLMVKPEQLVLLLLYVQEVIQGGAKGSARFKSIDFFLRRAGGMHLLLLLLNAHYNKRAVGRMPGWGFGVLRRRIRISERSLRLLVGDAIEMGLLMQLQGIRDRRVRVYCVTPLVVTAWEAFFNQLSNSLPAVLSQWGPGQIANMDFSATSV